MQPPIAAGTVLQNRYRVVRLLGQGGFGRTYLAEDQGRFNEACALKEFVPLQGADRFSDKATQLFQREASILYQIQHPQIPQFRATFEQDQRLFLVQDFVDGTNYRDLVNQRRSQNQTFSETEVRSFLRQILPVLAHIHAKGIIHRDISPDNLILRSSDRLPVLIDFGVVKEVVTRIQLPETATQATTVGKLGYAPSEQMQTGRAYPSSDLYALAVTAVVLLTGKEPQEMFDDVNLSWYWQRFAPGVTPGFTQVLERALSYRPGDRYQSVSEMVQALNGLDSGTTGSVTAPAAAPRSPAQVAPPARQAQPAASNLSQMKTVAVGRRYEPTVARPAAGVGPKVTRPVRTTPARQKLPPNQQDSSIWESPLAITLLGLCLALVAGLGGWGIVSALNNRPEQPRPDAPTPTIEIDPPAGQNTDTAPTDTDPVAPSDEPVEYSQTLNLRPGRETDVRGDLNSNETINYRVSGEAEQVLTATLDSDGVLLTVLGPDGQTLGDAQRVRSWEGTLPTTGEYTIQLRTVEEVDNSNYRLTVGLTAASETPNTPDNPDVDGGNGAAPDAGNNPPDDPQVSIRRQRVSFPSGATETRLASDVNRGQVRRYVVNAAEGQVMNVRLSDTSGPVTMEVRLPNGEVISNASRVLFWQGRLPEGGDYFVDVSSPTPAEFTLDVSVTGEN